MATIPIEAITGMIAKDSGSGLATLNTLREVSALQKILSLP
jgi:hypothetical protein